MIVICARNDNYLYASIVYYYADSTNNKYVSSFQLDQNTDKLIFIMDRSTDSIKMKMPDFRTNEQSRWLNGFILTRSNIKITDLQNISID